MNKNNHWTPHFGIKPGEKYIINGSIDELLNVFDFVEYQAPLINIEALKFGQNIVNMRPHSNKLVPAQLNGVPNSILKLLAHEVKKTKAPYLGEHLGYLNPIAGKPALGALFPPVLNEESLDIFVENAKYIQDVIEVPLAIETPAFYFYPEGSEWTFLKFLDELDKSMPKEMGWLIDIPHLYVSAKNLGESFDDYLNFYWKSNRTVFEAHICDFKSGLHGIAYDDHKSSFTGQKNSGVEFLIKSLIANEIFPLNLTIERELTVYCLDHLREDFDLLTSFLSGNEDRVHPEKIQKIVPLSVRKGVFEGALIGVVTEHLSNQCPYFSRDIAIELAEVLEYLDTSKMIASFLKYLKENGTHFQVPMFDKKEWDGMDLISPFIEFVREHNAIGEQFNLISRNLLLEMAIVTISRQNLHCDNGEIYVLFESSQRFDEFEPGTYRISVDRKSDNIEIEHFDSSLIPLLFQDESLNVFLFSEKEGLLWNHQRKEHCAEVQRKLPLHQLGAVAIEAQEDGL